MEEVPLEQGFFSYTFIFKISSTIIAGSVNMTRWPEWGASTNLTPGKEAAGGLVRSEAKSSRIGVS
ncbi:hypothetical protein ABEW34_20625 [Paenibacillus algorifonticola]|uniref:hypothetical protein n=1 Tax=Paenibacillus algorifonticola TaxID=684063 RepID=UPI003D2CE3BA